MEVVQSPAALFYIQVKERGLIFSVVTSSRKHDGFRKVSIQIQKKAFVLMLCQILHV